MTIPGAPLAHLTLPDLGLVIAMLAVALLLAGRARWLERRRR